jgi:hypothetical protein
MTENQEVPHTRRHFIQTGVLAAGGAAVSARSYARVAGSNDRVNVGMIGFGVIGLPFANSAPTIRRWHR